MIGEWTIPISVGIVVVGTFGHKFIPSRSGRKPLESCLDKFDKMRQDAIDQSGRYHALNQSREKTERDVALILQAVSNMEKSIEKIEAMISKQ